MFFNKTKAKLAQAEQESLRLQSELDTINRDLAVSREEHEKYKQTVRGLVAKYEVIIDLDKAVDERRHQTEESVKRLGELEAKYRSGLAVLGNLEKKVALYEDSLELTEYGLYVEKYNFELPEQYKLELESVYQRQKEMVSAGTAATCATTWTVGGSTVEGRKMVKQHSKLMLYAFNGECDAQIAAIRWNNVAKVEERIRHAFVNINKLGTTEQISLSHAYLELKLKEMSLNYEYESRKNEEKEEQRRIREQMREEEKAQRDFERAQKEAEEDERRFQKALGKARAELQANQDAANVEELQESVRGLEAKLAAAQQDKERARSMAQQTKVGHIYIISNIGSFGEDIYKIGMTRRLDPLERVRELSDASVPYHFDVHATIHSENAPQLEYDLHQQFKDRRLNRINTRKEFFKVPLEEIEEFVNTHTGATITFTRLADAREYRQTRALMEMLATEISPKASSNEFPASLF